MRPYLATSLIAYYMDTFSEPGGGSSNETGGSAIGGEEYGGIILWKESIHFF